ncbi:mucin-5AC isoform X2 [Cryptotermes secundus]|uniref:mucin-5AC isoform X2 n=1 Tax=Cryptotermes secundus TaxID=105785 RepID=UPI000CD7D561|nr:mucin-5AC isoform X2 [Cryptotermes secundus]
MPFVQRVVEPKFLSRRSLHADDGQPLVSDYELEAVTNNTLSSALRQLACLVLIANDIFEDLRKQLEDVSERSKRLRNRIESVEGKVTAFDPKKVTVPESDITTFSLRTEHFSSCEDVAATKNLFAVGTRPECVQRLYETAAKTPVHMMRQLDRYRRDGRRSSRYFLCTPILGGERRSVAKIKHKPGIDIETRMPAAVNHLRRWTSEEAFGDITVTPDCTSRIASSIDAGATEIGLEDDNVDSGTDHRLPSPEEQVQTVALRFPPELVAVDISGRPFDRMTSFRRSLIHVQIDADGTVRRRSGRSRKPRGRRRNTIAGTDQRELEQAITGENPGGSAGVPDISADAISVVRSASSDLLRSKDDSPSDSKKSHFSTLKQWGKVKLKLIRSVSGDTNKASPEETNIYETVTAKGKKGDSKPEKKQSSAVRNIAVSASSGTMNMAVKLREGSVRRRAFTNGKEDPLHSSSGNWSASSESGRASVGSENTATTHQPKSTTTLSSAATSSNSLNHHQAPSSSVSSRRKFLNTSASSSISEGTLTPDIVSDLVSPFPDDGETSSIYSCDTEGYYTSFHMDSGLKTLKEEESLSSQTPLNSTVALSTSPGRGNATLTAENEYELFGKGSTSTTTSSAGTVCTTLLVGNDNSMSATPAPAVPERKSSLEGKQEKNDQMVVAVIHKQQSEVPSESPDSGHNTSSSPVDSTNSPPGTLTGRSSEYEFSESDLEGVDRIERIRVKTTINSSRIPSMCVITPPQSDDETCQFVPSYSRKHSPHIQPSLGSNGDVRSCSLSGKRDNRHHINLELASPQESRSSFYNSLPRKFEKQLSTDSDHSSETEPSRIRSRSACRAPTPIGYREERSASLKTRTHGLSPSPTRKAIALSDVKSKVHQQKTAPMLRSSLQPFNNMIDKVKCVLSSAGSTRKGSKLSAGEQSDISPTEPDISPPVDAGDYVTIADVRNNTRAEIYYQGQPGNLYSNTGQMRSPPCLSEKMEYVSLNELPGPTRASSPSGNVLIAPSDSLERKKRQGARVTLDSEGKVVYSSDSLRRNKGAHTTFEPGPYIKDPRITTPVASPIPAHRVPKSNIRPVAVSNQQGRISPCPVVGTADVLSSPISQRGRPLSPRQQISPARGQSSLGYDSPHQRPPRYVSPPAVQRPPWSSVHCHGTSMRSAGSQDSQVFWTLPARRPQYQETDNNISMNKQELDYQHRKRFNTIATAGSGTKINQNQSYVHCDDRPQSTAISCYGGPSLSVGAYQSSQHKSSLPVNRNVIHQNRGPFQGAVYSQLRPKYPTPVSIPNIPNNERACVQSSSGRTYNSNYYPSAPLWQDSQNGFCSSTPTKDRTASLLQNDSTLMSFGTTFSPIEKYSRKEEVARHSSITDGNRSNSRVLKMSRESKTDVPKLVSVPKTSMTSEEIFVAIHKSKKRLNIKTDSSSYGRSHSPSCSSLTSLSPGSSESSIHGIGGSNTPIKVGPETGSFNDDNSAGSRHSWSPNSGEYFDFYSRFERRTPSPVTSPSSRQSWACDRLGPRQHTSRNDFKRLLLQQGAVGSGNSGGRISAVEQLKLTRQQKQGTLPSGGTVSNSYTPRSPAEKRTGTSKLLQSPRSNTIWRFASPRTDVLSSTILEDCAEEEDASNSPQHSQPTPQLPPATSDSAGHSSVQRPLNLSFDKTGRHSPNKDINQDTKPLTSQQTQRESSPRAAMKSLVKNSNTKNLLTSETNTAPKNTFLPKVSNLKNGSLLSPELLSPSNVKENVNTNLQPSGVVSTNLGGTAAKSATSLNNHQPIGHLILQSPSHRINMLLARQRVHQYSSHGTTARSILGALTASKSPPKATLETAL